MVTPDIIRRFDRGSRIHWLARLYTIGEATNRLETAQVWISPGPEYATRIRIPLRVDSGVAKNLLARRHFNEILERNPELQMHMTYTRFVAYGSETYLPLLGELKVTMRNVRGKEIVTTVYMIESQGELLLG